MVFLALLLGGCKPQNAPELPPPPVQVAEVLVTDVPLFAEYVGQTEARANVDVRARVEGFIKSITFREGSVVREGQILFQIEKEPIEQRFYRAKANLAEAEAALSKAQADITRYTPLVGLIGAKQADVGSLVGGFNESLLATISPLDPIWFNANVSEVDYLEATRFISAREIKEWNDTGRGSRPVRLILADGTEHPQTGKFIFMDRAIDTKTGTLRLRAEFGNPDDRLRPGMFGRIRVLLTMHTNVVLVPQRALQEIQGAFNVFKLDEDNKAVFSPVKPGARVGSLWIVEEGLKPGDKVVVEGLLKVRDGASVTPTITNINDAPVQELRKLIPTEP